MFISAALTKLNAKGAVESKLNYKFMRIIGIGTDIVNKNRIAEMLKRHSLATFTNKFLSSEEYESMMKYNRNIVDFCAKRFAAKEAICKALGCGIGFGQILKHITVTNNKIGKPIVVINAHGKSIIDKFIPTINWDTCRIHISISDEQSQAVAFAVAEDNN